ncbi:MAG: DUF3604 domain-containing protein [Phycisphaerales bacterium]|nr:MAG: DUF3604 domain-containing protein [Phycisphaerales bacterium]
MDRRASNGRIDRREFLSGALGTALAWGFDGRLWGVPVGAGRAFETERRVIFESSFEKGQPTLPAGQHTLVEGVARTGNCSMMGRVTGPNRACFLEVPFESGAGSVVHVSFWVRSDSRSACAVFVRVGNKRTGIARRIDNVPVGRWTPVEARYEVAEETKGFIQIVAPSSHNAPAGRAWVDDVCVWQTVSECDWPDRVQDFPAVAYDGSGRLWMAVLERRALAASVGVYRIEGRRRRQVCALAPPGLTGIGAPAIAALPSGFVVAFAVEQRDNWRIAYAFVEGEAAAGEPAYRFIDCEGSANISPAVAVAGEKAFVLWESNAGGARGIYSCRVDRKGCGSIERISSGAANSYNPAVVALDDGSLVAAWDSVRGRSADIYSRWFREGRWRKERRITSDARIERHPSLAVREREVWMAWQMQSYNSIRLNSLTEQRIAVARIDDDSLHAPVRLFDDVSTAKRMLMRPRIVFDSSGRLWLAARESIGQNSGWRPVIWSYEGGRWSDRMIVMDQQGRWRPVSLASSAASVTAVCQYDDLARGWDRTRGKFRNWRSGIFVRTVPSERGGSAAAIRTEPLETPKTDFSLSHKTELCAADLPRQSIEHNGRRLTLFWGDFHDHTDISVCNRRGNPPGHDLFANLRDIEKLDFCALTDHGYNFDEPQWAFNAEQTRNNHDPGRFVTFLAEEWTSSRNPPAEGGIMNRYGHHNLIFLNPYHSKFYDSFDGDISPAELWKQLKGHEFICIPHQLADWKGKGKGNPPKDWSYVNERLQPVAEIFQARQSYEYLGCPRQSPTGAPFKGNYLQDAWAAGIIIGVIASPDHGGGSGKVGLWAEQLTRRSIFDAVRARHTFGTSGAKMSLFFGAGAAMMGDKVKRPDGPIGFRVKALALRPVKELVIFRNNQIVHRVEPNRKGFELSWTDSDPLRVDLVWYYARIRAEDDELAWSSPIWFTA